MPAWCLQGWQPLALAVCGLLPTAPHLPAPSSAAEGPWGPEGLGGLRSGCGLGLQRDPRMGVPVRGWQDCARGHCPAPSARGVRGGGEQDCTAGALEGEVKPWLSAVALGH